MKIVLIIGIVLLDPVVVYLTVWALMALWNWIMAGVFGLPELTMWTAFGLYLILWLIGGFFKNASK